MASPKIDPTHKYSQTERRIYLSGYQTIVRMTVARDRLASFNAAGFVLGSQGKSAFC